MKILFSNYEVIVVNLLKNLRLRGLGISQTLVYRAVDRFIETLSVVDGKRSGRPTTVRINKLIKAAKETIRHNPLKNRKSYLVK